MNRATRLATIVMLRQTNTLLVHVHAAMHGIVHRDGRDGLTDKEKEYIMKRHAMIEQAQEDMSKLTNMMFRKYNGINPTKRTDF